jgi:3-oxoacyl-[acyl-carrier-protein] synthase II
MTISTRMPAQPQPPHRVAITGAGIITSMGTGWSENVEGFRKGRVALREITIFDASRQRVHRAGEVVFDKPLPATKLTRRQVARMDRASRLLVYAAMEARAQCGWRDEDLATQTIPVSLGTSAGAMAVGEAYYHSKVTNPAQRQGLAEQVMLYQPPTQAQFLMDALGIQGPVTVIANACASGANAIGHAFRLIKTGRASRAVCGGYDALAAMVFAGFDSLQALSTTMPRPFDANRDGLALGEGAAVLMLERYEDAVARGADVIAEITGYGAATDLHHLTQPHPQGDAALLSMTQACAEAGVTAKEVQYINSHGTGTPLNDVAEGHAIQRWAGADVGKVMVSSTKAGIGHLLGGAGAVETVICLMAMREGFVPPTPTIRALDAVCTFDLVREPRAAKLDCVLTNSFGFGGANATLVMKSPSDASRGFTHPLSFILHPFAITGWGSVSAAGWSPAELQQAVQAGAPLPIKAESRCEGAVKRHTRPVSALSETPAWMKHPRLRRCTTVARFAVHAAVQALGEERLPLVQSGALRVGLIFCTMNGCVQFSRRFYAEALDNPALASPILFPETVYNAPSSHLASLLGSKEINYTLVGDSAQFIRGIELAEMWLDEGLVEGCLVVAAEELDWISDEALMLFGKNLVSTEGAAAVFIERTDKPEAIRIEGLTPALTFTTKMRRELAASQMKSALTAHDHGHARLFHGLGAGDRADRAESDAWKDWTRASTSVRPIMGEGFSVTGGWQTVLACEAISRNECPQALVSAVGLNEQTVGMALGRNS